MKPTKPFPSAVRMAIVAALLLLCVAPATAQLKIAPSSDDYIHLLQNPMATPGLRTPFPGLDPLPELPVHSIYFNTLTDQPLLLNNPPYGISYDIPSTGFSPFVGATATNRGTPYRPLDVPLNPQDFMVDRVAAARLGKALFWDMQVGSDGVQACASCHFHAGADDRTTNQLNPGTIAGDNTLQLRGANQTLEAGDFPFHKLADIDTPGEPLLNPGNVLSDTNDVASSMGIRYREFVDIPAPGPSAFIFGSNPRILKPDIGQDVPDPMGAVFQGIRRVEPRNTPTFFSATHNFNNFWDGRARQDFNGGSPHGASDPASHIFVNSPTGLAATRQLIAFSSMASLCTGPALSNFEMSFNGRYWAKLGKKLLQAGVVPLAGQLVDPTDSVLGPLSNQHTTPGMTGLNVSYADLIEQAFAAQFWSNIEAHLMPAADPGDPFDGIVLNIVPGPSNPVSTVEFTQKEANFSMFFGLAVQEYTKILQPDDTPFDRFHDANPDEFLGLVTDIDPLTPGIQVVGLSDRQLYGYDLFQGTNLSQLNPFLKNANCSLCHLGLELTANSMGGIHGTSALHPITLEDEYLSGFMLEEALRGPAAGAFELDIVNQDLTAVGFPDGIALVDEGIYNIGVRPISEDLGRGADDAFGFPLSLAALSLRGAGYPVGQFSDPMNPVAPLPAHLAPYVNPFPVGEDWPNIGVTTFLPDTIAPAPPLLILPAGTYPNPNRVARDGSFKVPMLRNVELTGPYMHNGGMLTLRQVVDFYARGGDFPETNAAHRDPLMIDLHVNVGAGLTEDDKAALVDFLLSLTDERVKYAQAPFDHPELIIPTDGTAPDNISGPGALMADGRFRHIAAVGSTGRSTPLQPFLGVSSVEGSPGHDHFDSHTDTAPPSMAITAPSPGIAGTANTLTITGATPGAVLALVGSETPGSATVMLGHCGPLTIGMGDPLFLMGLLTPDGAGAASFSTNVPASFAGKTYYVQAIQPSSCQASPVMTVTF